MQIKGRTFIVSGGSSGLGLATAINIISNGGFAAILDINPPSSRLDEKQSQFTETDVTSTESLQSAIKKTLEWAKINSAPLAGVVCCAGISSPGLSLPRQSPDATADNLKYYDMAAFDRTLTINLRGTVDLIRLTLPHLSMTEPEGPDGERGVVVVVSSVAAYEGQVGQLAYSASKGAIASIVLPLARELGARAGIRVMGIAPGLFVTGMSRAPRSKSGGNGKSKGSTGHRAGVNTEMIQYPKRLGNASEFARLVKEIVENPMLNGFVIRLDGAIRLPSRL